ncbi:MAG: NUDIX domain-containing protein [Planctomycetota bacterium]
MSGLTPPPRPGVEFPTTVAITIVEHSGGVLVRRRPAADALLAECWEFPGGRVEIGETPIAAARRELQEETGLELLEPPRALEVREFRYPDRYLRLHFFHGILASPRRPAIPGWQWRPLAELPLGELPAANREVVGALLAGRCPEA